MGRRLHLILMFAIAALLASHATLTDAYPTPVDFDGSILRWDIKLGAAPITYYVDANHEGDAEIYGPLVDEAAGLWSNVTGSYFSYTPAEEGTVPQVTIYLQNAIEGGDFSAGYAIFDAYDGKVPSHCSIYVAVTGSESLNGLAKTFLHELGHCAGLGHSLIPEAIMSYELTQNSFALDIDDEAGLSRLYPADGSSPHLPPGCAVGAGSSGRGVFLGIWMMILPMLVAINSNRRRIGRPG